MRADRGGSCGKDVREARRRAMKGMIRRLGRRGAVVPLAAALLVALPSTPAAHEIPARVTILAFVKPEAERLRLIVRVPLEAMRDVEFPLRGPAYLELDRVQPLLPDAARDRKSTRLNSSHGYISYAVFCLKKKKKKKEKHNNYK